MKITVETLIHADLSTVWQAWNDPQDIRQWNAASDDWHRGPGGQPEPAGACYALCLTRPRTPAAGGAGFPIDLEWRL